MVFSTQFIPLLTTEQSIHSRPGEAPGGLWEIVFFYWFNANHECYATNQECLILTGDGWRCSWQLETLYNILS